MTYPKLITILIELKNEEWLSLKKYLSHKASENADVMQVFKSLHDDRSKLKGDFDFDKWREKKYPKMTSKVFYNYLSELFLWSEEWLVLEEIKYEKYSFDVLLQKALNRRGHYNLADQVQNKVIKQIDNSPTFDIEKSKAKSSLLYQQYYSNNPIKYEKGGSFVKEIVDENLRYMKEQLLLYNAEMYSWGKINRYDTSEDRTKLKLISEQLPSSDFTDILSSINTILETENEKELIKLSELILDNRFEKGSLIELIAATYCIKNANELYQKKIISNKVISELYRFAISNGIYEVQGKITAVTFRNLITNISLVYTIEETNDIIDKMYKKVAVKNKSATKLLAHAINHFYHNDYKNMPNLARNYEFEDIHEKAYALCLNYLYYFTERKEEYDIYEIILKNYESFLKRNEKKFSEKFYKGFISMIDILKKIDKNKKVNIEDYEYLQFRKFCTEMIEKSGGKK